MARFCATFDNTNTPVNALLAAVTGQRFQRRTWPASPGGAARRTALLAARQALSDAVYASMDAANRRGDTGIVVPRDALTLPGGAVNGTLYTNAGAIWPADPRNRPTAEILIAGSTIVSPTDTVSAASPLYADAQAALENCLTDIGVRTRLGNNPYRTLASLWHDHDLTFFAWDDFTPGTPTGVSVTRPSSRPATNPVTITIPFLPEFPADLDGSALITAFLTRNGGGSSTSITNQVTAASNGFFDWTVPGNTLTPGTYTLDAQVRFRDPNIATSFGGTASFTDGGFLTLT